MPLTRIKVKKGEGIGMLRDGAGYPYPDDEFEIIRTTYVDRRIMAGDLVIVKESDVKTVSNKKPIKEESK